MILEFVENEEKYYEFIRLLRIDSRVAYGFVDHSHITPEQQKIYMSQYGKRYYICLSDNVPVGFIGAVGDDLRIAILPEYQRKGIGSFMVGELLKRHPTVYARMKIDNTVSASFFKKLGFTLSYYIMTPPPLV